MTEQRGSSTQAPSHLAPEKFDIGEVAIWVKPGPNFGKELTVISSLQFVRTVDGGTGEVTDGWRYEIDAPGFVQGLHVSTVKRLFAEPEYLRKKRPPRKDLTIVRWADCPWQPESINV
jgi:hypothetical protein